MSNGLKTEQQSISVALFAAARDRAGQSEITVRVVHPMTVQDLRAAIRDQIPELAPVISSLFVAVNEQYAQDSMVIPADAEVACFPPVSGG